MELYFKLGECETGEVFAMNIIGSGVIVRNTSRKGTDSVFIPNVKLVGLQQEDGSVKHEIVPMFVEIKNTQE